jgi:hypothetical protein
MLLIKIILTEGAEVPPRSRGWDESDPLRKRLLALVFENVAFDRLSRNGACCTNIVTLCPEVLLSTHLFETREFLS